MAERVALIRLGESRKPEDERICYDPYAIHFISPNLLEFVIRNPDEYKAKMEQIESLFPGLANSVIARVRYFDDVVQASVDAGLEQLVILGAGYDTRAYRIEGLKGNIKVFEVDHPNTQSVKAEKIKEIFGSLPVKSYTFQPIWNLTSLASVLLRADITSPERLSLSWKGLSCTSSLRLRMRCCPS